MPNGYHLLLPYFGNLWSYLCSPRSSLLFFFSSCRSWGGTIQLYPSAATCVLIIASFVCQSKILPLNCLLKMSRWTCTRDLTLFRSQTEHAFPFRGRNLGIIIPESSFFLCYPHSVDNSVSSVQFLNIPVWTFLITLSYCLSSGPPCFIPGLLLFLSLGPSVCPYILL